MSEIGRLIDEYIGKQKHRVNAAEIARLVGVSRSTVSHWYRQSSPSPEHLRRLAQVLEMPYSKLVDAVVQDMGYYERSGEVGDVSPAAKSAAAWDRAAAALRSDPVRPLSEREIVATLGGRPGDSPAGENGGAKRGKRAGRHGESRASNE